MNPRKSVELILLCCILVLPWAPVSAVQLLQQETEILLTIYSPVPGQVLQGVVPVDVGLKVPGLVAATLEFRYANHPTDTWFLLAQTTEKVVDGILTQWDTTTITDGMYDLRLSAVTQDQHLEYLVSGLRIRNYTPVETETPTPIIPTETLFPGQSTRTPLPSATALPPTVTPLPTNPAIFTTDQFSRSLVSGSLAILGIFIILGLYISGRVLWRNRF